MFDIQFFEPIVIGCLTVPQIVSTNVISMAKCLLYQKCRMPKVVLIIPTIICTPVRLFAIHCKPVLLLNKREVFVLKYFAH